MELSHQSQLHSQRQLRYSIRTFAKLNLSLAVSPKRADGYHNIDSIFQTISLHDTLTIEAIPDTSGVTISCNNTGLTKDNIITTIYNDFAESLDYGFHIDLHKQIPIGAGLGGGSSNAAGFLWVLSQFIPELQAPDNRQRISQKWGADIPFFVRGGTAHVTGIGEIITPVTPQEWTHYVMIYPNLHISSRDAYTWFDEDLANGRYEAAALNHLKMPVIARYPQLRSIEIALNNTGVTDVRMSGSGSTLFVPCMSSQEASRIQTDMTNAFPDYIIKTVTPVPYGFCHVSHHDD